MSGYLYDHLADMEKLVRDGLLRVGVGELTNASRPADRAMLENLLREIRAARKTLDDERDK